MDRFDHARFSSIPNATGTLTRLAYANAKAKGADPRSLLKKANLTLEQVRDTNLRLSARDQIRFLNFVADELQDDLLGFHLAQSPDLREFGFLYYVSASADNLGDALHQLARYASIANEGVALRCVVGKHFGIAYGYIGVSRHLVRHHIDSFTTPVVRPCRPLHGIRLLH